MAQAIEGQITGRCEVDGPECPGWGYLQVDILAAEHGLEASRIMCDPCADLIAEEV